MKTGTTALDKDINTNDQVEGNPSYISAKANVLIMSHQRLQEQEILRQSEQGNRIFKEQASLKERVRKIQARALYE